MQVNEMRWLQTFLIKGLNLTIPEFHPILHTVLEEQAFNLDLWNKTCELAPLYGWKVKEDEELTMLARKDDLRFQFGADIQGDREFWFEFRNTLYEESNYKPSCKKRKATEDGDWDKGEKISIFTLLHEVFDIIKNS